MGRPRLSPWIDGSVHPCRPGVYQRRADHVIVYAKFQRGRWHQFCDDRNAAMREWRVSHLQGEWPWRGRAERAR